MAPNKDISVVSSEGGVVAGTRKRLVLVGSLALGAIAFGLTPALADSGSYTGPGVAAGCSSAAGSVTIPAFGVGGACFEVPPGSTHATIVATDDVTGLHPALTVQWGSDHGGSIGAGESICSGTATVAVWQGFSRLYVGTQDPGLSVWNCGAPTLPLRGSITVSFS
jgi:hypothetical protein